jgi:hypothetical protein
MVQKAFWDLSPLSPTLIIVGKLLNLLSEGYFAPDRPPDDAKISELGKMSMEKNRRPDKRFEGK